jgi:hypothetical protein
MTSSVARMTSVNPPTVPSGIADTLRDATRLAEIVKAEGAHYATPGTAYALKGPGLATSLRNICMMHQLERIAGRFNEAGVPLMLLKGAALHLTLYDRPEDRPMQDLDLLIRPEHVQQACELLEAMGARRTHPLVRDDFFPRYHYEVDYQIGEISPVRIDLHVRPFRPLRYSRLVPDDALWHAANTVPIGRAHVFVPGPEEMLIHLAAHAAIHGNPRITWLTDIRLWIDSFGPMIRWDRFLHLARQWHLLLPVRTALKKACEEREDLLPSAVQEAFANASVTWRDRLALWQAPRDAGHPVCHVVADTLCTPGWRFRLGYLRAVLLPDREHMGEWYCLRHPGWLPCAHVLRCLWPVVKHLHSLQVRFVKTRIEENPVRGRSLVAARNINAGEVIARSRRTPANPDGPCRTPDRNGSQRAVRNRITGPISVVRHSCRPNAELRHSALRAFKAIPAGTEITIPCKESRCQWRTGSMEQPAIASQLPATPVGDAARSRQQSCAANRDDFGDQKPSRHREVAEQAV